MAEMLLLKLPDWTGRILDLVIICYPDCLIATDRTFVDERLYRLGLAEAIMYIGLPNRRGGLLLV